MAGNRGDQMSDLSTAIIGRLINNPGLCSHYNRMVNSFRALQVVAWEAPTLAYTQSHLIVHAAFAHLLEDEDLLDRAKEIVIWASNELNDYYVRKTQAARSFRIDVSAGESSQPSPVLTRGISPDVSDVPQENRRPLRRVTFQSAASASRDLQQGAGAGPSSRSLHGMSQRSRDTRNVPGESSASNPSPSAGWRSSSSLSSSSSLPQSAGNVQAARDLSMRDIRSYPASSSHRSSSMRQGVARSSSQHQRVVSNIPVPAAASHSSTAPRRSHPGSRSDPHLSSQHQRSVSNIPVPATSSHSSTAPRRSNPGSRSNPLAQMAVSASSTPMRPPSFTDVVKNILEVATTPYLLGHVLSSTTIQHCACVLIHALFHSPGTVDPGGHFNMITCQFIISTRAPEPTFLSWMVFCAGWKDDVSSDEVTQWDGMYALLDAKMEDAPRGEAEALLVQLVHHRVLPCVYMSALLYLRYQVWGVSNVFKRGDFYDAYIFVRSIHAVTSATGCIQSVLLCDNQALRLDPILSSVGHEFDDSESKRRFRASEPRGSLMLEQLEDFCETPDLKGARLLFAAARPNWNSLPRLMQANSFQVVKHACLILLKHDSINWVNLISLFQIVSDTRVVDTILREGLTKLSDKEDLLSILISRCMGRCTAQDVLGHILQFTSKTAHYAMFRRFVALDFLKMGGLWNKNSWDVWVFGLIRHMYSHSQKNASKARRMLSHAVMVGLSSLSSSSSSSSSFVPLCLTEAVQVGTLPLVKLLFNCDFFNANHVSRMFRQRRMYLPRFQNPSPAMEIKIWLRDVSRRPRSLTSLSTLVVSGVLGCGPGRKAKVLELQDFLDQGVTPDSDQWGRALGRAKGQLIFEHDLRSFEEQW